VATPASLYDFLTDVIGNIAMADLNRRIKPAKIRLTGSTSAFVRRHAAA
jgi:hypothetical protein